MGDVAQSWPKLAFVPSPYLGEILGSWLARIELHNGRGAWNQLLEAVGYEGRFLRPAFDLAPHSAKLDALLAVLGTTYESVLWRLTTLPYWLVFEAGTRAEGVLPGTVATPTLAPNGRLTTTLRLMGFARCAGEALRPRYCPQCLAQDVDTVGEPFWHRDHQLPTTFFCPRHGDPLHVACERCGYAATSDPRCLVSLPSLRCRCGHDLRCVRYRLRAPEMHLALARLSAQAVATPNLRWDRHQVGAYFRSMATGHPGRYYKRLLERTFGVVHVPRARSYLPIPEVGAGLPTHLRLSSRFERAGARDYCVLLTAMGVSWDQAVERFQRCDGVSTVGQGQKMPSAPTSGSRRQELLQWAETHPSTPIASYKHYWYFRLNDAEWLEALFRVRLKPIPSIAEDRESLRTIACDADSPAAMRRIQLSYVAAGRRAQHRDAQWLLEQRAKLSQEGARNGIDAWARVQGERVVAMEQALATWLRTEERPQWISPATLGGIAGLSYAQAGAVVRAHRPLREAIDEANRDGLRRRALWGARQLAAEGLPLSPRAIAVRAGQNNSSMRRMALAVIEQCQRPAGER